MTFDPWNSTHLQQQLTDDGLEVTTFGQGYASMTAPTKELARLVSNRKLRHDGHPVLRWMMGNLMVERDAADNVKPSKKVSSEKIDGCVATIMALGRYMVIGDQVGSVYETRGPLVL